MKRFAAVIGDPVDHSLSPALHRRAFALAGLDWDYQRFQVSKAELHSFLASLPTECVGLSVTAPLKRAVLSEVGAVDGLASLVKAANTLHFAPPLDAAFNTDVQAIVDTVRPSIESVSSPVRKRLPVLQEDEGGPLSGLPSPVVMGTGATASSALAAVRILGASSVILVGRSFAGPDNAFATANTLGLDVHPVLWRLIEKALPLFAAAPLVISTVPPHVTEELAEQIHPDARSTLLDVTYSAGQTPLEKAFLSAGGAAASPLTMLTFQGIGQVRLWSAQDVPFEPVYEAVRRAASER